MPCLPSNQHVKALHAMLTTYYYHIHFTTLFPGPPGWADARKLLDFMVQGQINRGRHTDHPAGRHSIRTKQCPPPPSPIFYRPDALPAAQPTLSSHWRQLLTTTTNYHSSDAVHWRGGGMKKELLLLLPFYGRYTWQPALASIPI